MKAVLLLDVNALQYASLQRLLATLPWAHHVDTIVRKDGKDHHFETDWLKGATLRVREERDG